jgi:glycosyltransferase involved in cell wall biosynthesis
VERLKVLFLTNWYPTGEEPIKAVWIREHAKAVRIHDDVVVLHCLGPDPTLTRGFRMEQETDASLNEGIPTYRFSYRPSSLRASAYPIYLWSVLRALRNLIDRGFRPEIIHAHIYDAGGAAVFVGALHRVPVVVSEHFSSFPRRLLGRLDVLKAWLAFRWASVVLPVSQSLQTAIERYGIRARFRVIPNVADTALFCPPVQPRKADARKRILFVGQLVQVKGIPYLLLALSRLAERRNDWHLDIVGDGAARAEYEQMAVELELGDRVTFHGLKPKRDVAEFMRGADIFVLPSLCETFSAPAAEALAVGTPVLATRCGGPQEFIVEEVGLLVAPGDAETLRSGLDYMLENLHLYSRRHIAEYARERFSPECAGAQLHNIYRSLVPK